MDGNDLLLDRVRLLPPPAMNGKITSVRIERDALVQVFGSGARRPMSPRATAKNHIYWRGGQLTCGKLTWWRRTWSWWTRTHAIRSMRRIVKRAAVAQHKSSVPHAQIQMIPKAGHASFWDNAASFNQGLQTFANAWSDHKSLQQTL